MVIQQTPGVYREDVFPARRASKLTVVDSLRLD